MVKTSHFNAGGAGSIPGLGAKIPCALWPKTKTENTNNILINSIKVRNMVHIHKNIKERKIIFLKF